MRGLILSHPAVAAVLTPYLMTWWEGPDDQLPAEVLALERSVRYHRRGNVTAFVIAPDGAVDSATTPYPGQVPFDRSAGEPGPWFASWILAASNRMGLRPSPPQPPPPPGPSGIPAPRGCSAAPPAEVRTVLHITGDPNVHIPILETTRMPAAAWTSLAYPATPRHLDAATAAPWLATVYPPAMMDQENRISRIGGQLVLEPSSPNHRGERQAVLTGEAQLELAAATAFRGRFHDPRRNPVDLVLKVRVEILLAYPDGGQLPGELQGVVRGSYGRPGHHLGRNARMVAAVHNYPP